MIEFMHEGGFAMVGTLVLFVITAVLAVVRRSRGGERIAVVGAVLTLASGLCGMSTGLYNTVAYASAQAASEQAEILGVGIRESVHNTLFAGLLATGLGVIALTLGLRSAPKAATA